MITYICPNCKKKEDVKEKLIFYCDDCSTIMINEKILDIARKNIKSLSEEEIMKCAINQAKAMKKSFGEKSPLVKKYLTITKIIDKVTPEMIKKFEVYKKEK